MGSSLREYCLQLPSDAVLGYVGTKKMFQDAWVHGYTTVGQVRQLKTLKVVFLPAHQKLPYTHLYGAISELKGVENAAFDAQAINSRLYGLLRFQTQLVSIADNTDYEQIIPVCSGNDVATTTVGEVVARWTASRVAVDLPSSPPDE